MDAEKSETQGRLLKDHPGNSVWFYIHARMEVRDTERDRAQKKETWRAGKDLEGREWSADEIKTLYYIHAKQCLKLFCIKFSGKCIA